MSIGDAIQERYRHALQGNGLRRLTGPRRVIMKVLSEATDHPDVVELHRRVNAIDHGIAIATVYRTVHDRGIMRF